MYSGFPRQLLQLIRCPKDQSPLRQGRNGIAGQHVNEGTIKCTCCGRLYPIMEGIPVLIESEGMDEESRREQAIRDESSNAGPGQSVTRNYTEYDHMEMRPTIGALELKAGQVLLEFGCGTGRYTVPLANMGISVIAVDFSMGALRRLAKLLPSGLPVGLVQADVTSRCVAHGVFDRILATLVSNLPTKEHRLSLVRVASEALKDSGTFVFSTHHQNIVRRLLGLSPGGRYADCGIYRYHMRPEEIRREAGVYFGRISCRPICVNIPFSNWTGLSAPTRSRIAELTPLLRQKGELLLARTRVPIRPLSEGQGKLPNAVFARLYAVLKSVEEIRSKEAGNETV